MSIWCFAAAALAAGHTLQAQEVALTFDDLPRHSQLPPGLTRFDIIKSIVATLKEAGAPKVYGFVNANRLENTPGGGQALELWKSAGFPLGSHSYSHMDLHSYSAEAFKEDIARNEPALRSLMGMGDWRWFRYPYLREGDTLEKRRAVRAYLEENGYRIAQVTLDFEDYLWNAPFARCVAANNSQAIEWLKDSYLDAASEFIALGQQISRLIYGRDIKHVLVLHVGGFQTVILPEFLGLLKQRGFKLITLEEAHSDPAYESDPDVATRWGDTLLEQMLKAKGLKIPRHQKKPYEKLKSICR